MGQEVSYISYRSRNGISTEFTPAYPFVEQSYVWEDFALQEANMRSEVSVERQLFWNFSRRQTKQLLVVWPPASSVGLPSPFELPWGTGADLSILSKTGYQDWALQTGATRACWDSEPVPPGIMGDWHTPISWLQSCWNASTAAAWGSGLQLKNCGSWWV